MRHALLLAMLSLFSMLLAEAVSAQWLRRAVVGNLSNCFPSISDDADRLLWVRCDLNTGYADLHMTTIWGTNGYRLTTICNVKYPGGAVVSGDGRTVVFIAGGNVYTIPATGGNPRRVTGYTRWQSVVRDLAITRDGGKAGFTVFDAAAKTYNYAILDSGSLVVRAVTKSLPNDVLYGTMSGDGSLVAFTAKRGNVDRYLWFVGTDGKNLRRASTVKVSTVGCPSLDHAAKTCAFDGLDGDVYTIRTDGTRLVNVSQNSGGLDRHARLSSNGDRIFWMSIRSTNADGEVWMAFPEARGGMQTFATSRIGPRPPATTKPHSGFAVNGDGTAVVYASEYQGLRAYELWYWTGCLARAVGLPARPGRTVAFIIRDWYAAGASYWLRSAFARSPGISLPGVGTVPLTPDSLFFLSGQSPTICQDFTGKLGSLGGAVASIRIPNAPLLRGVSIHTCALIVKTNTPKISNPLLIRIE